MMAYAENTDVSITRSVAELDKIVTKYGASGFAYGRDDATSTTRVMFRLGGRMIRFDVAKPDPLDYAATPTGRSRAKSAAATAAESEERRRWRALVLVVKALLVAVEDGVVTPHEAFLPWTVLPSGETVGEWAGPQLDRAYTNSVMPALIPGAAPQISRKMEG